MSDPVSRASDSPKFKLPAEFAAASAVVVAVILVAAPQFYLSPSRPDNS